MEAQDRSGSSGAGDGAGDAQGTPTSVQQSGDEGSSRSSGVTFQSPLFAAEHAGRYQRQQMIREYEEEYNCRLIVIRDAIFGNGVTMLEELLFDADPSVDLHMILDSPGGDGEVAVRMARSAQRRCNEFTVIVPDMAKSAATILAMGAHHILMGPASDLGPVDPQFQLGNDGGVALVAAKDIIAAVEEAEQAVSSRPESYPIHAALLGDVSALMVQQARSAISRTDELVLEALRSCKRRTEEEAKELLAKLKPPLIDETKHHGAIFGAEDAARCGLPVVDLDPTGDHWKRIWTLWAKYVVLHQPVYEGRKASRCTV